MNNFEKLQSENVRAEAQDAILVLPVGAVEVRIAALLAERLKVFVAPAFSHGARSLPRPKSASRHARKSARSSSR